MPYYGTCLSGEAQRRSGPSVASGPSLAHGDFGFSPQSSGFGSRGIFPCCTAVRHPGHQQKGISLHCSAAKQYQLQQSGALSAPCCRWTAGTSSRGDLFLMPALLRPKLAHSCPTCWKMLPMPGLDQRSAVPLQLWMVISTVFRVAGNQLWHPGSRVHLINSILPYWIPHLYMLHFLSYTGMLHCQMFITVASFHLWMLTAFLCLWMVTSLNSLPPHCPYIQQDLLCIKVIEAL